ncbi:MAG: hypothetical protein LBN10_01920 [Propionibacteriaceae bacterium]|nr:hypothetical protein [Propionibacteriaceae bacterium]
MSIDRLALVSRHNPHVTGVDPRSPLQLGNGQCALSVDVTGLQTFPQAYPGPGGGTLLDTMATWGWHSMPYGRDFCVDDCLKSYDTPRGPVTYMDMGRELWGASADGTGAGGVAGAEGSAEEVYFRANPHRISLARIGLVLPEGTKPEDLSEVNQQLDLATGFLKSTFCLGRTRYDVTTVVDMDSDTVAFTVRVQGGLAEVCLSFPYASENPGNAQDWDRPDSHKTRLGDVERVHYAGLFGDEINRCVVERTMDDTAYVVEIVAWGKIAQVGPHEIVILDEEYSAMADEGYELSGEVSEVKASICFRSDSEWNAHADREVVWPGVARGNAERGWWKYWATGAVSLASSDHPQAVELERRVVLSRYLTRINSAGLLPVAETGLYTNSWRGKFHLEMQWWHLAHFASWGNPELVEQVLAWYEATLDSARDIAKRQGYPGARWLKSSGPEARETPSSIAAFLVWQQPHVISLANLVYRAMPLRDVLQRWWPVVAATATFMAEYPIASPDGLVFPPPLIPSQECYAPFKERLTDPTFELASWVYGLCTAADWAERLGESRLADHWRTVASRMKKPSPVRLGDASVYPAIGVSPWTTRVDHPSMVAALGLTPDTGLIDPATMEATLLDVRRDWDWGSTWGWDYPMMAMTATRVGRPDLAVDSLLFDKGKNTYLPNGHNWQTPELPAYLPGNGGLLSAVALMAAGWDGSKPHPGFGPEWVVEAEGIGLQA